MIKEKRQPTPVAVQWTNLFVIHTVDTRSITAMRILLQLLPDHGMKARPNAIVKIRLVRS